ncbi:MAG: hypothetical protein KGZ40_05200 [Clostridiales bacterium]|nr:hypothetical protein [Clostridiales bacterium]
MSSSKAIVMPVFAATALAATAALAVAALFAAGVLPAAHADAAPRMAPQQLLGVGERVASAVTVIDADDKVPVADGTAIPAAIMAPPARAKAPLPKPAPKPRVVAKPRAATPAAPSRAADSGAWLSARASWYGPGFYGRRTASGAVLTQGMMNVAHKTLPFGTQVQFEYRGRVVTAVVNDRGPHIAGRVWDLGPGTAKALGFTGVATVNYRILGR